MFHPCLQKSSSSKIFRPAMPLAPMESLPQSSNSSCRVQKKGGPNKCKHGFPKKINVLPRVVCRGNARRFQVSTKGRRNALGLWLGTREDAWLSGTMTAFSVWLFGNSHTAVNYRVPLCSETHDPECQRNCLQQATAGKLQRLMQQAARRATRYFTGYLQKPQPVGRKELHSKPPNSCISSTQALPKIRPGPTIARWPVACLATLSFDVPSDQSPKSSC